MAPPTQVPDIVVDSGERYAYQYGHQQTTTTRHRLPAGDYAVTDGDTVIGAVERKSVDDLSAGLTSGKLTYQLADLAGLHRDAVVVEATFR